MNKYQTPDYEILKLAKASQNATNVFGWNRLNFSTYTKTPSGFDATVFQRGNNIIISMPGTSWNSTIDAKNDIAIFRNRIPAQFNDAKNLYSEVIKQYPKANIEFTGYSLGGTNSNLMSHYTGLKSTAFSPIGSKNVINSNLNLFKFGDTNIKSYGVKGDALFMNNLSNQSGDIFLLPKLEPRTKLPKPIEPIRDIKTAYEAHMLHNYPDLSTATKHDPTKINMPYELKPQNFSNESTGLSNSASVSNQLIQMPQNVPSLNLEYLAALGNLGQTTSVMGSIMGLISPFIGTVLGLATMGLGALFAPALSTSASLVGGTLGNGLNYSLDVAAKIMGFHNGGLVPGQGEVSAILKGGETVRTKPQEEELQQQLYQKYIGDFAPTVCGEQQQATRQQQNNTENNPQKPIHQQITKDDEMFILNLVADAIDRNRMGLRTKMQGVRC